MTFEEWWEKDSGWGGVLLAEGKLARAAWNAAIDAAGSAIEAADHNDDDSGHVANCNAIMAVEKLITRYDAMLSSAVPRTGSPDGAGGLEGGAD